VTPTEFREARQSLGLTQAQMAAVLHLTSGHVSRIERGVRAAPSPAVPYIAALLAGYRPAEWPGKSA
jgi:transcriptional regulator with XRE-family HTH domain